MTESIERHCTRDELERLRDERDLYESLLSPAGERDVERVLANGLDALVDVTAARRGFVDLRDECSPQDATAQGVGASRWQHARGYGEASDPAVGDAYPRDVVTDALLTGEIVERAPRAVEGRAVGIDPSLPPVLCAPLFAERIVGVLYVEGVGCFGEGDRRRVALVARLLAPLGLRLLERLRAEHRVDAMQELRRSYCLRGVIGRAPALAAPCRQAMRAARLDINVLLTGASGTGKSQLARLIHRNSARSEGPFVELNCAALPVNLIESELFGARAGSHSQAIRDVPGKVEAAEGGTLFLDEITELPVSAQAKLLQLIQSRDYYPLGGTDKRHADVRMLAATNVDLAAAVAERRFREDLYFRLHVMPIRLPTLAERRDDVPLIAREICDRVCERHRLPPCELSPCALRMLRGADWPGNVRQLAHVVEAAAIRATTDGSGRIEPRHLFPGADAGDSSGERRRSFHDATRDFQCELLREDLEATGWNVTETARRLDLARSHVYNLIHGFGLCRDRLERPAVARVEPSAAHVERSAGPAPGSRTVLPLRQAVPS